MHERTPPAATPAYRALAVLAGCGALWAVPARAQYIQTYFPTSVPGYDQQLGVTVLSRLRPEYETPGVQVGSFTIRPELDELIGYDSNPSATPSGPGSWELKTGPSISANSNWENARVGGAVSAQNYRYFNTPDQNHTDYTVALGGGVTLRQDDDLSVAYSHLALHENAYDVGSIASTTPTPFSVDDLRTAYKADLGRFTLTPNLELQHWQFGTATVAGVPSSQSFLNRNVLTLATTGRYALTDISGALVVVAFTGSNYTAPTAGQPTNNSRAGLVLVGLDSIAGVFRYRVLVGYEVRTYEASVYPTHSAPIAEANVIWQPTGLTTVTGDLAQTIEDATSEGTAGFNYTTATLRVDHEYQRNILLNATGGVQRASFIQGSGSETSFTVGAGATYLLTRHVSIALNYDFTHQTGTNAGNYSTPATSTIGIITGGSPILGNVSFNSFQDHLLLLTFKFAL